MLRSLRYWMNQASHRDYTGPREGAVLLRDGSVVHVPNLTNWHEAQQILGTIEVEDVVATFVHARNGWCGDAEVQGLRGRHTLYADAPDLDTCMAQLTKLVVEANTKQHAYDTDPVAKLEALLLSHDWYSAYSDDGTVARAGEQDWSRIASLMAQLKPEVVRPLFAKYAPAGCTCPV